MNKVNRALSSVAASAMLAIAGDAVAQSVDLPVWYTAQGGAFFLPLGIGRAISGAPYSADVTSTVTQVLADGTRIEQSVRGKVYRDSAGRMRREQQVIGLGPLTPADAAPIVTITDPTTRVTYTLDERTRTARPTRYTPTLAVSLNEMDWLEPFAAAVRLDLTAVAAASRRNADAARLALPVDRLRLRSSGADAAVQRGGGRGGRTGGIAPEPEQLGSRQVEGVTATGVRLTQTIPVGQIGNDRPIVITEERWESPDLQTVVYSKHHDPRTGDVEYRLHNISRTEPPASLFQVPATYTIVGAAPPAPPPPPGLATPATPNTLPLTPGVRGGRGGRSGGAQ
jgi:hypothetical protein